MESNGSICNDCLLNARWNWPLLQDGLSGRFPGSFLQSGGDDHAQPPCPFFSQSPSRMRLGASVEPCPASPAPTPVTPQSRPHQPCPSPVLQRCAPTFVQAISRDVGGHRPASSEAQPPSQWRRAAAWCSLLLLAKRALAFLPDLRRIFWSCLQPVLWVLNWQDQECDFARWCWVS